MNRRLAAILNLIFSSSQIVVTVVVGLVLVPIYLQFFSAATYGAWLASAGLISMTALLESGLGIVLTQKLSAAYGRGDKDEFAKLASTGLALSFVLGVAVVIIGTVFSSYIVNLVNAPVDQISALKVAVILSSIGTGLSFVTYSLGAIPQSWQKTFFMGIVTFFGNIFSVIIVIGGLYYWHLGVISISLRNISNFLVYFVGFLFIIIFNWRKLGLPKPSLDYKCACVLVRDSSFLLLSTMSRSVSTNIQAPVVAMVISPETSTILDLTSKIFVVVRSFSERVGSAVFAGVSHLSQNTKIEDQKNTIREILVISRIFMGCGLGGAIAFTKPVISLWVGPDLFGGFALVLLIAISVMISSLNALLIGFVIALNKIRSATLCNILDSLLQVTFIAIFVFSYGIYGIPLAGAIASFVTLIMLLSLLQHKLSIPSGDICIPGLKGFLINVVMGFCWAIMVPSPTNWLDIIVQVILCSSLGIGFALWLDASWLFTIKRNMSTIFRAMKTILRFKSCRVS